MAYQFCHLNYLVVNMNKTKQLAYGRRRDEIEALPDVDTESYSTFLGLTIDENLSWTHHIGNLSKKINISLFIAKKVYHISDSNNVNKTFYTLLSPILGTQRQIPRMMQRTPYLEEPYTSIMGADIHNYNT